MIGYTRGMKTAVSIPNPTFKAADRLARRLGVSRSRLYAEALQEYLHRHQPKVIAAAIEAMNKEIQSPEGQAWLRASMDSLRRIEW